MNRVLFVSRRVVVTGRSSYIGGGQNTPTLPEPLEPVVPMDAARIDLVDVKAQVQLQVAGVEPPCFGCSELLTREAVASDLGYACLCQYSCRVGRWLPTCSTPYRHGGCSTRRH